MPQELPRGWAKTKLGEVCLPIETLQPKHSPDTEFTYFDIGGIDNERNRIAEIRTVTGRNAPSRARQLVRKGDILFSTVRTYLRKIARVELDYPNPVASTGFTVIRPAEEVSSQFLFFQVLSDDFLEPVHKLQSGTSYPAVRHRDVLSQPIVLPPSREQDRIAAKLSAAFASMERAESAAGRALGRVQRYRTSVLNAAVTGKFTRDWRESRRKIKNVRIEPGERLLQRLLTSRRKHWEEAVLNRLRAADSPKDDAWKSSYREPVPPDTKGLPALPTGWTWASIDQLSWHAGYGTSVKCTYDGKGPAVLRIPNIRNRAVDFGDLKFAVISRDLSDKLFVAPGDFLVIRTNGSKDLVGRAAVVTTKPKKKHGYASYLIRFRLIGKAELWPWLALAWDTHLLRAQIEARAKTTAGQYNLSLSGLRGTAIPLPPQAEQSECLREVSRRLSAADRLETVLQRQLLRANTTRHSLLRQAFTGRLVPQVSTDESASVLLRRIRAAREAETQRPKGERMPKSKSKAIRRPLIDVLSEHKKPVTPELLFREAGFDPSQVDEFYRELASLRDQLREQKPKGAKARAWPHRANVLLQLKGMKS